MDVGPAVLSGSELRGILVAAFGPDVPDVAVVDDGVVVTMRISARAERPGGTVSGPVMMTLADTGAWMAVLSRVGAEVHAVTTSLHIDFLRKPALVDLEAHAQLVKLGRKIAVVRVTICSVGSEDPVAIASVTFARPSSTNS